MIPLKMIKDSQHEVEGKNGTGTLVVQRYSLNEGNGSRTLLHSSPSRFCLDVPKQSNVSLLTNDRFGGSGNFRGQS